MDAMATTTMSADGERSSRSALIAAVIGPLALLVAALIVFSLAPSLSGSDAPARIAEFYSDDGGSATLLVAEPLALIGIFTFLWLTGRIRDRLGLIAATSHGPQMVLAGGIAFAVLAGISLVAQTTVAGTAAFSSSFEADPHAAMLLGHFGYVTLAAAMIGGSVMAFAFAGAVRPTDGRSATVAYVVGALGLVGMLFVYLPLTVFLLWTAVVGIKLPQPGGPG